MAVAAGAILGTCGTPRSPGHHPPIYGQNTHVKRPFVYSVTPVVEAGAICRAFVDADDDASACVLGQHSSQCVPTSYCQRLSHTNIHTQCVYVCVDVCMCLFHRAVFSQYLGLSSVTDQPQWRLPDYESCFARGPAAGTAPHCDIRTDKETTANSRQKHPDTNMIIYTDDARPNCRREHRTIERPKFDRPASAGRGSEHCKNTASSSGWLAAAIPARARGYWRVGKTSRH